MSVHAVYLHNLLAFKDSGWFEFRPVTYIYGRNSSGKSAISNAFLIIQKAMKLRDAKNNESIPGIEQFSKVLYKHSVSFLNGVAFEFKCLPRLGLISQIKDFSKFKDLDLQEDREFIVFQVVYKKVNGISPGDFGIINSISIHLFENRMEKDDLTGQWLEKKIIIDIHRDYNEPLRWVFRSDFLELETETAIKLLEKITLDDSKPIPLLKSIDSDLYNLLSFSLDEFPETQQQDEGVDPYKDYDNPKNIIRYLDRFLRDISSDVIGFVDSVKFINPTFQKIQNVPSLAFNSETMFHLNTAIREWESKFGQTNLDSNLGFGDFVSKILSGNTDSGYDLPLNLGQQNSLRILFNLLLLERDDTAIITHPDAFLDTNNQLDLADFLVMYAIRDEKKIVIETHSKYLLLRIQKRLRQINSRRLPKNLELLNSGLDHTMVGVLFCTKNLQGDSMCQTINLDEEGDLVDNWPGGFYEEDTHERFDD